MLALFGTCLILSSPPTALPDNSTGYFTGLQRPRVDQIEVRRDQGPVILIVVDALRPDRLPAYGFERDTAPNLTRLADEGLVLTNYFVNGNWTRPSTASILTGLAPATHGVERDRDKLADQFVTLAEVLGDAGIPTGAVVGNGNAGSAFGLGRGFDFYADTVRHWKGLPSAEQVVELALPFVRQHAQDPFFLMLFFVDPHDPYHAPGEFENMFVEDESVKLIRTPHWELGRYTPAQLERMKATYDGAVRYTDTVLGGFFDRLRELGIYDDATIIVTADHGEAFGEHGVFLHAHHFYDEIVRVPFIVRAPHMSQRGAYNHYLFQAIDLLPTVAGLYGAPVRAPVQGVNLFGHLARPELNAPDRMVVSQFNNFGIHRRMIRTYDKKLIYEAPADADEFAATVGNRSLLPSVSFDRERFQLYDVLKDPHERNDLSHPKRLRRPKWRRLANAARALDATSTPRAAAAVVELDPETLADLRALGYVK